MIVKLLCEHRLEFLNLKEGWGGSSESTLVKMSNCWESHALAQIFAFNYFSDVYHNYEDVVPLILELFSQVVQKYLCFLKKVT